MGGALLVLSSMAPLACAGRQQTKRSESAHLVCLTTVDTPDSSHSATQKFLLWPHLDFGCKAIFVA